MASSSRQYVLRNIVLLIIFAGVVGAAVYYWPEITGNNKQTLRRADSFFGFHFDFHAGADCNQIGHLLTEEMIDTFLLQTQPDYIQVDCKGHNGYSSYPTQVGNQAPGFEKDILQLFREVTRKHHVALYVHYSGIWDNVAMQAHPEWAARHADGTPDTQKASFYGAYDDSLLIPQLKELAQRGIDGIWVDGECWAAIPDYSDTMRVRYQELTGHTTLPQPGDADYKQFLELNRTAFRDHIRYYIDAVHKEYPDFQITSNWAYSSMMPEEIDTPVDYLSGDVAGQNGVYSSAWEARCLAPQGKSWDLMSWGFTYNSGQGLPAAKSVVMLQQEAAEVISMGGGFQVYYQQNRDGSLKTAYFPQMAEIARWCRERQEYCHKNTPLPQIALWYSTYAWKDAQNGIYSSGPNYRMSNILALLLDGKQSVEVLMDHHLKKSIDQYPLIVLPEWANVGEEMKKFVLQYVENGGNLLVMGVDATRVFAPELGIQTDGEPVVGNTFISQGEHLAALHTRWQQIVAQDETQTLGEIRTTDDKSVQPASYPFATYRTYGKGKIGAITVDLAQPYASQRSSECTHLVNQVISALYPAPRVAVEGNSRIHLVATQREHKWVINLINVDGDHSNGNVYVYDQINPTRPVKLIIRPEHSVRNAYLIPGGEKLSAKKSGDHFELEIPSFDVHTAVVLSF